MHTFRLNTDDDRCRAATAIHLAEEGAVVTITYEGKATRCGNCGYPVNKYRARCPNCGKDKRHEAIT